MDHAPQQHRPSARFSHSQVAAGPLVLLAEPDAVVAVDVTDALEKAGYRVAGPMRDGAEALAWLERNTPDCAVIDIQLADGFGLELGRSLHSLGVPFLVLSADTLGESIAADFWSVPWSRKPCWAPEVIASLSALLPARKRQRAAG